MLEWDGARFRLHDLASDYARERLLCDDDANIDALRMEHAVHYTVVYQKASIAYCSGDARGGLTIFRDARVEFEAAVTWLELDTMSPLKLQRLLLLGAAVAFAVDSWYCLEWQVVKLLAQISAAQRLGIRETECLMWSRLGLSRAALGQLRQAAECHVNAVRVALDLLRTPAVGIALQCNLWDAMAQGISNLALLHVDCYPSKSQRLSLRALEISRRIGRRRGEGDALGNLGIAHVMKGDFAVALSCFSEALNVHHASGNLLGVASCLSNMGFALVKSVLAAGLVAGHSRSGIFELDAICCGFFEHAVGAAGLRTAPEPSESPGYAWLAAALSSASTDSGMSRLALASRLFFLGSRIHGDIGNHRGLAYTHCMQGLAECAAGHPNRAASYFKHALRVIREHSNLFAEVNVLTNLGTVESILGRHDHADALYDAALMVDARIQHTPSNAKAYCLFHSAIACWTAGRHSTGIAKAAAALELSREFETPIVVRIHETLCHWRHELTVLDSATGITDGPGASATVMDDGFCTESLLADVDFLLMSAGIDWSNTAPMAVPRH